MRDMYEVMDRWGAWAASDNSGVDWQPIAVSRDFYHTVKSHVSSVMMMKAS